MFCIGFEFLNIVKNFRVKSLILIKYSVNRRIFLSNILYLSILNFLIVNWILILFDFLKNCLLGLN